ncbi:MAG: hypothetical protein ACI8U3_002555 [Brevundimonas sp.]|jgi:hypothetical protein
MTARSVFLVPVAGTPAHDRAPPGPARLRAPTTKACHHAQ